MITCRHVLTFHALAILVGHVGVLQHSVIRYDKLVVIRLTGTVFQVLLMNRSLPDDWLYDRVMLQLLETAGTVRKNLGIE